MNLNLQPRRGGISIIAKVLWMSPLRGSRLLAIWVYTDAEETPKQINPTGLKNMSVSLKLTPMARLQTPPPGPGDCNKKGVSAITNHT